MARYVANPRFSKHDGFPLTMCLSILYKSRSIWSTFAIVNSSFAKPNEKEKIRKHD